MLPDIRAAIAAIVAAVGLMMAAFGVAATLRVAQQHQSVSLQADLGSRGRSVPPERPAEPKRPANSGERAILIVDTPGPLVIAPAQRAAPESVLPQDPKEANTAREPARPEPAIALQAAPLEPPVAATSPPAEAPQTTQATQGMPPAEPPIGGPLAESAPRQPETPRSVAAEGPSGTLKRAAAEKARKARAARVARERKAAAKRAAQNRRARPPSSPSTGSPGTFGNINQIGGTFRQ